MNTQDVNILNEIISLQVYFKTGYDRATVLRKRLEGKIPSAPRKGLSADDKAKLTINLTTSLQRKKGA